MIIFVDTSVIFLSFLINQKAAFSDKCRKFNNEWLAGRFLFQDPPPHHLQLTRKKAHMKPKHERLL